MERMVEVVVSWKRGCYLQQNEEGSHEEGLEKVVEQRRSSLLQS